MQSIEKLKSIYSTATKKEYLGITIGIIILIGAASWFLGIQPYYEAKTFNRLTNSNVSYFDAVMSDLVVNSSEIVCPTFQ